MVLKKRADGLITGAGAGYWDDMVDVLRRTRTKVYDFSAGGTEAAGIVLANFIHTTGAAQGWQVNAATEWAIAKGHVPDDYLTFVSLKIYGVSEVLEPNEMHLELEMYGAASNEPFATETISVTNKDSETTNFIIGDVVYWDFVLADDADFGDLTAGDSVQIKVIYEGAVAPDCATEAVFRYAVLEYTVDA